MDLDPHNAYASLQSGLGQIYALALSYSMSVIGAVLLLITGYFVASFLERWLYAGLSRIRGFDVTLCRFFASLARYAILVFVVVMVLGQFGVQTASIIAAIGAVGLAIGLALQGTLQNIAAGIMLLFLRPFRIGDAIAVGSIDGDVEEIGLFATRLRAADGIYILAPNSKLWNEPVRNSTRNRLRRNDITVGVPYDSNVDLAEQIMIELATGDAGVKKNPAPTAFVAELGAAGVSLTLRHWTSDKDFLKTKVGLNKSIKTSFDRRGIRFLGAPASATSPPAEPSERGDVRPARPTPGAAATRQ